MRLASWLEDAFGSRAKIRVLRYLSQSPREENTLSEISRALRMGLSSARVALLDLDEQGFVESRAFGNAHGYRIRRAEIASILRRIFALEPLLPKLQAAIRESVAPTATVLLFGSAARGEQTRRSDLDMLVVGATKAAAERAGSAVADAIGRIGSLRARFIILSRAQAKAKRGLPWLENARKEGRLLHGPPLERWFQ